MENRKVDRETTSVMQAIREHLLNGKLSRELIGMGYKPGTVFKIQWQLRKKGKLIQIRQASMSNHRDSHDPVQPYGLIPELKTLGRLEDENEDLQEKEEEVEGLRPSLTKARLRFSN